MKRLRSLARQLVSSARTYFNQPEGLHNKHHVHVAVTLGYPKYANKWTLLHAQDNCSSSPCESLATTFPPGLQKELIVGATQAERIQALSSLGLNYSSDKIDQPWQVIYRVFVTHEGHIKVSDRAGKDRTQRLQRRPSTILATNIRISLDVAVVVDNRVRTLRNMVLKWSASKR